MSEPATPITKQYFDEQIEVVVTTVKKGFDHVDERFKVVDERFKTVNERLDSIDERFNTVDVRFDAVAERFSSLDDDMTSIKDRLRGVENEVRALGAAMVTKQYLDAKIDQLLAMQEKDSLFKRTLLLALESARVLSPEMRAKLEMLIT